MNSYNFLYSQGQQLQDIEFYKREFLLHVCCGDYPISLLFSKIIKASNVDIKDLLEKLFKMSPPPMDQFFVTKNSGNIIQNFFRGPIQKKNEVNKANYKSQIMLLYYYLLHYIQFYYDPNIRKIDYTKYYLNTFLTEFSDPKKSIKINNNNITGWAEQLYQYMTSSLDIPQNQFQMILKGLLLFATQDKALYYSLRPQASSILARIGAQNYIPILQFNIFDVLISIDPSILILFPPDLINSSNIDKFLQYPSVLFNSQFINLSQNLIGATEQFPLESSLFKESNLLTLVNHSIMKRKQFIDIVFSLAHNTLMTRDFNNVENILAVFSDSPQSEIKPFLMLLDFNDLYPDQEFLMTVIPYYIDSSRKTQPDSKSKENNDLNVSDCKNMNMLKRLKNDYSLLTYINQAIGINITIDGLSKETFPKYLSCIMRSVDLNDFEHFSNLEYFILSDNDRDMDFNFFFLYFAFFYILNTFKESHKKKNDENKENQQRLIADKIEKYLHNVKFNQDILIDIFSLLFIQDRITGEYVANIEDARVLLSVLVQYAHDLNQNEKKTSTSSNNNYLSTIVLGFTKVQQFFILNEKSNISSCFVSTLDTIISALEKHDYEIALRFASQSNSPILIKLVHFSETIYLFMKSDYNEEIITNYLNNLTEKESIKRFLLELAMTTNDKINEICLDNELPLIKDYLIQLIQARQKNKNGRNSLLKSVESSEYLKDVIDEARLKMFFGGNEVSVDWSDENDNENDDDETSKLISPEAFPTLSNFIKHYELFLRLSIGQSQSSFNNGQNSDQSLGLILNSIIQSDKIDNWETFTQLVGSNALEMIILHCDLSKASTQIINLIHEQMPIISELIEIQKKYQNNPNNLKKTDNKLSDKTINKILNLIGDKNKELSEILTNKKKIESDNSYLSLFVNFLNDFTNCDKATFIFVLFKLINDSDNFIKSGKLLFFIDIIDDILVNEINSAPIMSKVSSLLIDEIINFYDNNANLVESLTFPTEFIFELRLRTDHIKSSNNLNTSVLFSHPKLDEKEIDSPFNVFLPSFVSDRKKNLKLSLVDLSNIFPEKVGNDVCYFIKHGITSTDPKQIIGQLIEKHKITYAQRFSKSDSYLSSLFNDELVNYTTKKVAEIVDDPKSKNIEKELFEFVSSLFDSDPKLATYVYSELPNDLVNSKRVISEVFESFSLCFDAATIQEEIQHGYDGFNEQIAELLNEKTTIEWIQIVVDYVLNIYLNPNEINEMDDDFSIFIKKQNIILNEEQKKRFISNIQASLLYSIKKHFSVINTFSDEQNAFNMLNKSIEIIKKVVYSFNFGTPSLNKDDDDEILFNYSGSLKFLNGFVREEYNRRFGEKYSLSNIKSLVKICIKYDNFELIKEKFMVDFLIGETVNVPLQRTSSSALFVSSIRDCFVEVAKNLLLLNQTEEYTKVLDFLSRIQKVANCDSKVDLSDLLRILSHPNFFDLNFNKEIVHVEVSPLYYRVKMIINGNMALVNKEFFKLTDRTIECFNGEKELLRFHNKYGQFEINVAANNSMKKSSSLEVNRKNESSFSPVEELLENDKFMKIFNLEKNDQNPLNFDAFGSLERAIEYVIFPALSFDNWNGLWRFLIRNISSGNVKLIIDEFLEFLREKNMKFALFDIENRLQMREDAILVASEIFHDLCTWSDRANYSSILKEMCETEMKSRKNDGKKPEKVSDGVLNSIYEKAAIYSEFCQFCHDTKTNFDKNLDIFTKGVVISSSSQFRSLNKNRDESNSKDHMIELMAFLAFVKKNFVLGLKIARTNENCVQSVIRNSIETIFYAGNNEIKAFMNELRNQLYSGSAKNSDYETISIIAVECIEKILAGKAGISRFILDYISGNKLQVSLLVKYGFPYDALKICNHDKQNIKIVQEYALKMNDSKLIRECKKILS